MERNIKLPRNKFEDNLKILMNSMEKINVDELYNCCETLDIYVKSKEYDSENIEADKHAVYKQILGGVKSDSLEKRLSAQLIVRFFKYFPKDIENAIDALLDLCEDEDLMIRKQAIRELISLIKNSKSHVRQISDVFTQLLITDDKSELILLENGLLTFFKFDPAEMIEGAFNQILNDSDPKITKRALSFVSNKLRNHGKNQWSEDTTKLLIEKIKLALVSEKGDNIKSLIDILYRFESIKSLTGRKYILDVLEKRLNSKEFDLNNQDSLGMVLTCMKSAVPFFSKNASPLPFFEFYQNNVIPALISSLSKTDNDENSLIVHESLHFELMKILVNMSFHIAELTDKCPDKLGLLAIQLHKLIVSLIPKFDEERISKISETLSKLSKTEKSETELDECDKDHVNEDVALIENFKFSFIETTMSAFTVIAQVSNSFYTDYIKLDEDEEKSFKFQLSCLARLAKINVLYLKYKKTKSTETSIDSMAMNKFPSLIAQFMRNPPSFNLTKEIKNWYNCLSPMKINVSNIAKLSKRNSNGEKLYYVPPKAKYKTT